MGRDVSNFAGKAASSFSAAQDKIGKIGSAAQSVALKSAAAAAVISAPLVLAANDAIKFEDRQADIAKTTGLSGKALQDYSNQLLALSTTTRTGIEDLQKIGEIGGQLGVATNQLTAFTKASNEFAVALGSDYGGTEQAITQVGKINKLFSDTKGLDIASSITRTGSAINELGAVGSGTSANINDFVLRMGALPDTLKPAFTATAAMATYLEELGINAEIGAGGLTKVLLDAGKKMPVFAKQMGITAAEAKALLAQDPTAFVTRLATSFKGVAPDVLAKKLRALGIDSQESIKVLGALGTNTARLAELQGISNKAFTEGTSLTSEYGKKNSTTAAQLAIAKNNMQALSITVGTQLLPVLTDVLKAVMPVIQSVMAWAKENPRLVKSILLAAAAVAALLFAISAIASVVAGVSALATLFGSIGPAVAVVTGLFVNYLVPAVQVVWAVLVAIAEVIAAAIGTSVGVVVGVFLLLVSIVHSLYRNWGMVVDAFTNGGILQGLLAIGKVLLDAILYPLQKILELAASIPGVGKFAASGAASIAALRADMGMEQAQPVNTKATQQEALNQTIQNNNNTNKNMTLTIKGAPEGSKLDSDGGVMPNVGSTYSASF